MCILTDDELRAIEKAENERWSNLMDAWGTDRMTNVECMWRVVDNEVVDMFTNFGGIEDYRDCYAKLRDVKYLNNCIDGSERSIPHVAHVIRVIEYDPWWGAHLMWVQDVNGRIRKFCAREKFRGGGYAEPPYTEYYAEYYD